MQPCQNPEGGCWSLCQHVAVYKYPRCIKYWVKLNAIGESDMCTVDCDYPSKYKYK